MTLTNMVVLEAKKAFLSKIKPHLVKQKKRKLNLVSGMGEKKGGFLAEFDHEAELKKYY